MKFKIFLSISLISFIVIGCSNKSRVDSFLNEYESVIKKWEQKSEKESLRNYAAEINKESLELTKKSDELKNDYPIKEWDKSQVDRFIKLAKTFSHLQLEKAGSVVAFPQPYDGNIRFNR